MSKKLDQIRKKIDTLDNKIHDLLMERADLIVGVAEEKRKKNVQVVHPAREAKMIRRLLARHKGPLPDLAILSIWRELVGAVCMMQTGLKVSVAESLETNGFQARWDMAKNYFGSVLPMMKSSSTLMAVAAVRENETSFAVLPWPHDGVDVSEHDPWWSYVYRADQPMNIVFALPYGFDGESFHACEIKAFVLSKIDFIESGEDESCIVLEVDASISRARIVEELEKMKITPKAIFTKSGLEKEEDSLHMIIIEGFHDKKSTVVTNLPTVFEDIEAKCKAIGGYPIPPRLKKIELHV